MNSIDLKKNKFDKNCLETFITVSIELCML